MGTRTTDYDLVVYGASGFTGRQAAATIARRAPGIRWCIAGRNQAKLEQVRAELGLDEVPIEVADALDEAAIDALVARTRVVLTTAGPYARFGNAIVASCVAHGVDYVDITGETPWVRRLMDQHGEAAKASGARIVPFCGFDSVPSDLGAWFMVEQLRQRGTGTKLVRGFHKSKGGFNGGTLATAYHMAETGDDRVMGDRTLLNPPDARQLAHKPIPDPRSSEYIDALESWTLPFFMGPVNSRVVRRSAALASQFGESWGEAFDYEERLWLGKSAVSAKLGMGVMGLAFGLMSKGWGRALLKPMLPDPGEGPTEEAMDGGFTKARFLATGEDGTELQGEFFAKGDPGNRVTVGILCECALALVEDREALPGGPERTGFLTPSLAFGEVLLGRLREVGMSLAVTSA